MSEPAKYDRKMLYEEVWAEPVRTVAVRYGVSDVALAKTCRRLGVPVPGRGYWARKAAGVRAHRPSLPPDPTKGPASGGAPGLGREVPIRPPLPGGGGSGTAQDLGARLARPSGGAHYLVAQAREALAKCRSSRGPFLRPFRRLVADISVSQGTLERALAVAESVYSALENASLQVMIAPMGEHFRRGEIDAEARGGTSTYDDDRWAPQRITMVYVGTVEIGLSLFETLETAEAVYRDGGYVRLSEVPAPGKRRARYVSDFVTTRNFPTGLLRLRAYAAGGFSDWRKEWTEREPGDLESQVASIVREVVAAAPGIAEQMAEGERKAQIERARWAEEQRKYEAEQAAEQRRRNVVAARAELLEVVQAWSVARSIEAFFEDADRRADALSEQEQNAVRERVRTARDLLGGTDAIQRLRSWRPPNER